MHSIPRRLAVVEVRLENLLLRPLAAADAIRLEAPILLRLVSNQLCHRRCRREICLTPNGLTKEARTNRRKTTRSFGASSTARPSR